MMKDIKVLGICGREGAGKSTVANILQFNSPLNNRSVWETRTITNPLLYITHVLFGFPMKSTTEKDPIWGFTQDEAFEKMSNILINHVDKDWFEKHPTGRKYDVPFPVKQEGRTWYEFSMADPLKRVSTLIFDIPYDILFAQTPELRKLRETTYSPTQSVCGKVTGRYCLEYFGTDVMRNTFDNDIWIKILKREALKTMENGNKVVIPDIRFPNEGTLIDELDGTLLTIYKNPTDLVLTDEDQKTHPAKWKFLTFNRDVKKTISIHNDGTIDGLKTKLSTGHKLIF